MGVFVFLGCCRGGGGSFFVFVFGKEFMGSWEEPD